MKPISERIVPEQKDASCREVAHRMTVMHIELSAGEALQVGDATITLVEKSGKRARLTVQASACTAVTRQPATTPSALECAPPPKERHHGQYFI